MFQYNADGLILQAGPQVGFLLSATENGCDETNDYENLNVALGFGAAYRLQEGVGFEVRYNAGVSSMVKTAGQNVSVEGGVWQFGFGFSMAHIGKR